MMLNYAYETLRDHYKPDNVEVLFVGESRPQGGTFFIKAILHYIEKQKELLMNSLGSMSFLSIDSKV